MSYDSFANYYDSLMVNADYDKRAEYYRSVLTKNGIDKGILLDLGCGTGNMSIRMADYGYEVIGIDASVGMLMKAMQKSAGRDILLLNQTMEDIDLYGTVDCALSVLDCINHLDGKDNIRRAFDKVSLFMNPGGLFIFDVNTIHKHRTEMANNCFILENDDVFCAWQNTLNEDDSVDITLDFFTEEDGIYYRDNEYFSERAYPLSELKEMLDNSGFDIMAIYDDMTENEGNEECSKVVFVARKR